MEGWYIQIFLHKKSTEPFSLKVPSFWVPTCQLGYKATRELGPKMFEPGSATCLFL